MSRALQIALALAATLAGTACPHNLEDGAYALTQQGLDAGPAGQDAGLGEGMVDTCHTLPANGTLFSGQMLTGGGDLVYTVVPIGTTTSVQMFGEFKQGKDGEPDELLLNGTILDQPFVLNGTNCLVHFGQLQLAGTQDSTTSFFGTLTSFYNLNGGQPGCPIRCDLRVGYRANRTGP